MVRHAAGHRHLGMRLRPMFRQPHSGHGLWLTIELDDVDAACDRVRAEGLDIAFGPVDEPWGDRHFAVVDPNGIPVDFVRHTPPPA